MEKVTLKQIGSEITETFELAHAERILRRANKTSGWELPTNSEYTYTEKNGIRKRANSASDRVTESAQAARPSVTTSR